MDPSREGMDLRSPDGVRSRYRCGGRGMMISRRPNRRASTDRAPGPRKTTATATSATKPWNSVPSRRLLAGVGITPRTRPRAPHAARAPASGVSRPSSRRMPAAIATRPRGTEALPVWTKLRPSRMATVPRATRSRSRPMPGHPVANVEKSLCRMGLLGVPGVSPAPSRLRLGFGPGSPGFLRRKRVSAAAKLR